MSVINSYELTMKCDWNKFIGHGTSSSKKDFAPKQELKCLTIGNKMVFKQDSNGYSKVPAKLYILDKTSEVKAGDMIDGVFVRKVDEVNDFDGTIDHLEVYTFN